MEQVDANLAMTLDFELHVPKAHPEPLGPSPTLPNNPGPIGALNQDDMDIKMVFFQAHLDPFPLVSQGPVPKEHFDEVGGVFAASSNISQVDASALKAPSHQVKGSPQDTEGYVGTPSSIPSIAFGGEMLVHPAGLKGLSCEDLVDLSEDMV